MKKFLISLVCLLPMHYAGASVLYRVQTNSAPTDSATATRDGFASRHRFYVGGAYDFSFWQNDSGIAGKNASGFDAVAGFRVYDTFRIEADYMNTRAKWNDLSLKTNSVFVNAIFDARIDNLYRFIYNQKLVPYVGAGVGMTWVDGGDVNTENETVASLAALAGIAVELGEHFAIDFGYRYVYMFELRPESLPDLRPRAHQLRAGVRVNF